MTSPAEWPSRFRAAVDQGAFLRAASGLPGPRGNLELLQVAADEAITPARLQGRMHATVRFLAWGAIPLGSILGGWLVGEIGLRETMWVAGAGGLLAVLTIVISPVRSLRTIAEAMPAGLVAGGSTPGAAG